MFKVRFLQMLRWALPLIVLASALGCRQDSTAPVDETREVEITILSEGDGAIAEEGDRVFVEYRGSLVETGVQFDSNIDNPESTEPFSFVLGEGSVIQGWDQGVVGMKVGETRELVIPSHLGYGEHGGGEQIPPNADLRFDIKLLALIKEGEEHLWDVLEETEGTGAEAQMGDTVAVHYTGRYVNGKLFDDTRRRSEEPYEFTIGDSRVMTGFSAAVEGMKVGGTRTVQIPPAIAWGSMGNHGVTGNQILIFTIERVR